MRALLLPLVCLAVLSLLEFRALELVHGRNLAAEVEVARGVLAGRPYWKAYQNRLLGPLTVAGVAAFTGHAFADVYRAACFALLYAANATCFFLFQRGGAGADRAWLATLAYAGLFLAYQDPEWLYLWDYIDLTIMLLFAWATVAGTFSLWQVALLYMVELANREAAQFIALWLVLSAFSVGRYVTQWRVKWRRLGLGLGLGVAGALWTGFIRDRLCKGETGVLPRPEIHEFASGQFWMGRVTLDLLREPPGLTLAMLVVLLGGLGWLFRGAWAGLGPRAWPAALTVGALVAANGCLAFIFELRVWFVLLPFAVCLALCPALERRGTMPAE